jgi:hypothetical protein
MDNEPNRHKKFSMYQIDAIIFNASRLVSFEPKAVQIVGCFAKALLPAFLLIKGSVLL